jgi:hypothetical protein
MSTAIIIIITDRLDFLKRVRFPQRSGNSSICAFTQANTMDNRQLPPLPLKSSSVHQRLLVSLVRILSHGGRTVDGRNGTNDSGRLTLHYMILIIRISTFAPCFSALCRAFALCFSHALPCFCPRAFALCFAGLLPCAYAVLCCAFVSRLCFCCAFAPCFAPCFAVLFPCFCPVLLPRALPCFCPMPFPCFPMLLRCYDCLVLCRAFAPCFFPVLCCAFSPCFAVCLPHAFPVLLPRALQRSQQWKLVCLNRTRRPQL